MRLLTATLLVTLGLPAAGQHALEIIPLRHRTVDQVLPALRPLLEPGGTLAGQASQLIVRASPANLVEIRQALQAIDRPLRRLQILVRFDERADAASQGVEASGRVGTRGAHIDVRAHDQRAGVQERIDQRVQVLEGGRAVIATGLSSAQPRREVIRTPAGVVAQETMVIRETATGFEVVPRLAGETVFLDISPQRETPAQYQRAATTVSARLGEWLEVGGIASSAARDERTTFSGARGASGESRRIWVKVEEIR